MSNTPRATLRHVQLIHDALRTPRDAAKYVFVVEIPTSPLRAHMVDGVFYIRSEGSSALPMRFHEVRDQMLYTEGRLQRITLLRMELATFVKVLNMLIDPKTWLVRLDPGAFKVLLADISELLPPDSGLLSALHDIGSRATILNPLLDRQDQWRAVIPENTSQAYEKSQFLDYVLIERTDPLNLCGRTQNHLEEIYGPLKTS